MLVIEKSPKNLKYSNIRKIQEKKCFYDFLKMSKFSILIAIFAAGIQAETISCNGSTVQAIPYRCTEFVHCDRGSGIVQKCVSGTVFHKTIRNCVHPWQCNNCCLKPATVASTATSTTTTSSLQPLHRLQPLQQQPRRVLK